MVGKKAKLNPRNISQKPSFPTAGCGRAAEVDLVVAEVGDEFSVHLAEDDVPVRLAESRTFGEVVESNARVLLNQGVDNLTGVVADSVSDHVDLEVSM